MDDAVELSDLIWQLRHELSRAMWAGENTDLRFKADTVELELTVVVEKVNEPGVKVRFWVLDAGASARRTVTTTQTLRLSLRPHRAGDPDHPAVIAGDEFTDED